MPNQNIEHREQLDKRHTQALREALRELPDYATDFFRGIQSSTSTLTRLAYATDLRLFFDFLSARLYVGCAPSQITLEQLAKLKPRDYEIFLDELTLYERGFAVTGSKNASDAEDQPSGPKGPTLRKNGLPGKQRKLASLRSFFRYLYKRDLMPENPLEKLDMPRLPEKPIVRLEVDEVARLLDLVDNGEALTDRQRAFHEKTRVRDAALLTLLLGTGIRVSECVGLDIEHIDMEREAFRVTRKGGDTVVLYLPQEVVRALQAYLDERLSAPTLPGHEHALFLSLQQRRLDVRSVQNLVKKYAQHIAPLKPITPHKLRSTFGTNLYHETGDIYLVADVLGHSDVNTTRKHYAAMADERRRTAAKATHLRE